MKTFFSIVRIILTLAVIPIIPITLLGFVWSLYFAGSITDALGFAEVFIWSVVYCLIAGFFDYLDQRRREERIKKVINALAEGLDAWVEEKQSTNKGDNTDD